MIDQDAYRLLTCFADGKPHGFFEAMKLTAILTKKKDRYLWNKFKNKLLFNGWIRRLWKSPFPHTDIYQLTDKGDNLFRSVQIRRATNEDTVRHYKYFDRDPDRTKFGVNLEDNVSEQDASLKEKLPDLYKSQDV